MIKQNPFLQKDNPGYGHYEMPSRLCLFLHTGCIRESESVTHSKWQTWNFTGMVAMETKNFGKMPSFYALAGGGL